MDLVRRTLPVVFERESRNQHYPGYPTLTYVRLEAGSELLAVKLLNIHQPDQKVSHLDDLAN